MRVACAMTERDDARDEASMTGGSPCGAWHEPVMVRETLHHLAPRPGMVIVDATVGTGGHSAAILPHLLPSGQLIAIDRDREALDRARRRLVEFEPSVIVLHGNYRELPRLLASRGISRIDGLLLDLGMSSAQVDDPERGFSFLHEGPLDMRLDRTQETTAATLVNSLSRDALIDLLSTLGEEPAAGRVATRIVEERRRHPITTTTQLAGVILRALPPRARHGRLHAATKTFQALRIAVNDELGALQEVLGALEPLINRGGRVVAITFHSLEDRLVKHRLVEGARSGRWSVLTKKPIRPSAEEVARNPRARSAKLRACERVA